MHVTWLTGIGLVPVIGILLFILYMLFRSQVIKIEKFISDDHAFYDKVMLINMDSRKDRLEVFHKEYMESDMKDLPYERISAVVGKESGWQTASWISESAKKDLEYVREKGERYKDQQLTEGAVGCYLSHLKIWERAAKMKNGVIVCEDDLDVPLEWRQKMHEGIRQAEQAMKGSELPYIVLFQIWTLYLGEFDYPMNELFEATGRDFTGTACYYISSKSAAKFVKLLQPIDVQIDAQISEAGKQGKLRIFSYRFLEQKGDRDSDIQVPVHA